jgi:hypothetical protein
MDEFKLGSAHDGWDMVIGKDRPVVLNEGIIEDGMPEKYVGFECEIVKERHIEIGCEVEGYSEMVIQYGVQIEDDIWLVSSESITEVE